MDSSLQSHKFQTKCQNNLELFWPIFSYMHSGYYNFFYNGAEKFTWDFSWKDNHPQRGFHNATLLWFDCILKNRIIYTHICVISILENEICLVQDFFLPWKKTTFFSEVSRRLQMENIIVLSWYVYLPSAEAFLDERIFKKLTCSDIQE